MSVTASMAAAPTGIGELLRTWRARRRLSQLDLAVQAGISQRHLSFIEIGRANPSREMVMHLACELDIPLRDRNTLLLAAGYAPVYPETPLESEEMLPIRHAIQKILSGHEPYPALVVNRSWDVVWANDPVRRIFADQVAVELLVPRPNVIRVALHPDGLAPHIRNLAEYAAHVLTNLRRAAALAPDEPVAGLYDEVRAYPTVAALDGVERNAIHNNAGLFVPMQLRTLGGQELRLVSTVATFGTARDLTVAELSIESFFPADKHTAAVLQSAFPLKADRFT